MSPNDETEKEELKYIYFFVYQVTQKIRNPLIQVLINETFFVKEIQLSEVMKNLRDSGLLMTNS